MIVYLYASNQMCHAMQSQAKHDIAAAIPIRSKQFW